MFLSSLTMKTMSLKPRNSCLYHVQTRPDIMCFNFSFVSFFEVKDFFFFSFKPACLVVFAGCRPYVLCCLFCYVVLSPRCSVSTVHTEAAFMLSPLHKKTPARTNLCFNIIHLNCVSPYLNKVKDQRRAKSPFKGPHFLFFLD